MNFEELKRAYNQLKGELESERQSRQEDAYIIEELQNTIIDLRIGSKL